MKSQLLEETGFPAGAVVKNLSVNAGDAGLIPGLGRSPGVGNGNPLLLYSCLRIPWTEELGGLQSMDASLDSVLLLLLLSCSVMSDPL